MIQLAWRRLFSFSNLLVAGLAVITCLTVSTRFNDPDLWWHLKVGEVIWTTHAIPATDIFSFTTHNHAWTAHEWLSQLSIYTAWHLGGYAGLMAWLCVLASLIVIGVYHFCRMHCESALVSFLGAIAAWFFATAGLAVRPLILGHLCLVAELLVLEVGLRKNRRWLWLLPPLFAVWVNCHGSYFFGMGVLGVYWICCYCGGTWGVVVSKRADLTARRRLLVILILCGLALCVNPVGPRLLFYPLDALFFHPTGVNVVTEWMPPGLLEPRTVAMLGVVAVMALFGMVGPALGIAWTVELRQLLLFFAALVLACQHARMSFLFGIVVAPLICRLLGPLFGRDQEKNLPVANAILMACCAIAILVWFPSTAAMREQVTKSSPVAAVNYIRAAGLRGPMMNDYVFGGYLIWSLPEEKVFIDGRSDVFEWTGVLQEYMRWATLAEDPAALLDKYGIRLCVVPAGSQMVAVMPHLPGWRRVYADPVAAVFVR